MIDRIITFSIRNRSLVILAGLVLALWGVYAVYHTPMDAIPDLSENQVIVFTDWMGHSPREVEDQVTYPLALHLQGLAGVRTVRSSSDFNFSMINVIFEDDAGFYFARERVAERLARAAADLPPGVVPELAPDAGATGQIFWYTVEGGGLDLGRLRAVQDWYVRPQLQSVPGVAEVASVGGYPVEYQIDVDPNRLRAHGVTLADVVQAVSRSNGAVGGHVVEKGNAEYIVRGVGWLGQPPAGDADFDPRQAVRDLENVVLPWPGEEGGEEPRRSLRLADVAAVALGPAPRRGVLEKDGSEAVGGVVLMRQGENPLEVTRRLKEKMQTLRPGLPAGVRLVPFYDRTPLIEGAVATVTGTLVEAILTAAVCVLLVLLHFRTSFVIALTLPLSVLASFAIMWTLRRLGVADVQTNVMSLAGMAISIGVLVDSSVVMAENVMHHLRERFGDRPVTGDVRELVLPACRAVGRPIFFSVLIMLLSFLPIFALGGIEGKMFRPLAFTKSFALLSVAALAVTLVPALCTIFIRGRLRGETDSWLVRSVVRAYRPVLDFCLSRPAPLVWFLGVTLVVGLAPLGNHWVFLAALFLAVAGSVWAARSWPAGVAAVASLIVIALVAEQTIRPLDSEFLTPLDEGMTMDMPITVPRASVTESADDLKERDMIFCRFPEVDMVVGKAGRAETPTDPAPLDMIETMVNFRPQELWPRRKLRPADAGRQGAAALDALLGRGLVRLPDGADRAGVVDAAVAEALPLYDALMREYAYQRNQEFERDLGPGLVRFTVERLLALLDGNGVLTRAPAPGDVALLADAVAPETARRLAQEPTPEDVTALAQETVQRLAKLDLLRPGADPLRDRPNPLVGGALAVHAALGGTAPTLFTRLHAAVATRHRELWRDHVGKLNGELFDRATATYTRVVLEALLDRTTIADEKLAAGVQERKRLRAQPPAASMSHRGGHHHHHDPAAADALPALDPQPELDAAQEELTRRFAGWVLLWPKERSDLAGFGGELDRVMQMPGWTNVWTMPIQNRVDMLSTGVNTAVGIRVLGRKLDDVVRASEEVAAVVRQVPGAADVIADPVRGKGYLEVRVDREKALRRGVSVGDVNDLVETALGGKVVTQTVEGRERHPVRVRYPRRWREDEESVRGLLVPARDRGLVPLGEVADVRVVEGPATIKSENGLLRNYVRLNVRGRHAADFVEEARRAVAERVGLPEGVYVEWTGQFEHEARARSTLLLIVPVVLVLIFLILYWTYHDLADALLMLLAVPGAVAGGVFCQWLFGYKFSVTVWVGYIACFGMATATGIIMLVYLRQAVEKAGGLANLSADGLRQAVLDGAVHRLRPKLLTEGITVLGLAPLLWATGPGADVIRPMVVPVLGGILIADEVIDLFLPVLFYRVRRWRWQRLRGDGEGRQPSGPRTESIASVRNPVPDVS
jgi:Cu(I)/Ag(I) efflux system membrane protein CusA/SilA